MIDVLRILRRSLLHFITGWALLTQPAYAQFGFFKNMYENAVSAWNNVRGVSTEPISDEPNPATPLGSGCSHMNYLSLEVGGINDLIDHFESNSCDRSALSNLASSSSGDKINAVQLCHHLKDLKTQNICGGRQFYTQMDVEFLLEDLSKDDELAALEKEIITDNLQEDIEKMKSIANLQTSLSTDPIFVDSFYKNLLSIGQNNPREREKLKRRFNLDDSFFFETDRSGNQVPRTKDFMSLSEFIPKAFSCLPTPESLMELDSELQNAQCESRGGLLPGAGENILDGVRENLAQRCLNKEEGCDLSVNSSEDLYQSILPTISEEVKQHMGRTNTHGSIAYIDPTNMGANHLNNTHKFMGFLLSPSSSSSIFSQLESVIDESRGRMSEQELRKNLRNRALNVSIEIMNTQSDFLSNGNASLFQDFIRARSRDGELNIGSYTAEVLKQDVAGFLAQKGVALDPSKEEDIERVETFVGLVQQAAVGQRVADYYYERNQQVNMVFPKIHNMLPTTGPIEDYTQQMVDRTQDILDGARSGELTSSQVVERLKAFSEEHGTSGLWKAAVELEGLQSESSDPAIRAAHGLRNIMRMIQEAKEISDGSADHSDKIFEAKERFELTMNMTLMKMAERAQVACKRAKRPQRIKERYCSPLSSPDYGAKGLEKLLSNPDMGDPNNVINNGLTLCLPIFNEDLERRIEAQNIDPLSREASIARNEVCSSVTEAVLCGGGVCTETEYDNHGVGLAGLQRESFGRACARPERGGGDEQIDLGGQDEGSVVNRSVIAAVVGDQTKSVDYTGGESIDDIIPSSSRPTDPSIRPKSRPTRGSFGGSGGPVNTGSEFAQQGSSQVIPKEKDPSALSNDQRFSSGNFATASDIFAGNQMGMNTPLPVEESLVEQLGPQKDVLDPATKALLDRLEDMERKQRELQAKMSEKKEAPADDPEKARLLAELADLKKKIPQLEDQIKNRQDVEKALAVAERNKVEKPVAAPSNEFRAEPTPVARIGGGTSGGAPSQVQAPANQGGPVNQSGGGFATNRSGSSSSEGPFYESAAAGTYQGPISAGFVGGDGSVLTLTSEIRNKTSIVPAGTSPDAAVLEKKGPVLIPLGNGEYTMYEPELTADGEVLTRDGEVVYKLIAKVADEALIKKKMGAAGRMPASIEEAEPVEDASRRRYRLEELEGVLEGVSGSN